MESHTNIAPNPTDNSDRAEPARYEATATELIQVAENQNPMQRRALMHDFLNEIEHEVAAGSVKNGKGEAYTLDTVNDQLMTFAEELNQKREAGSPDPVGRIPRHEGLRVAFDALITNEATAQPLLDAITERQKAIDAQAERVDTVAVQELGGEALESAGVEGLTELAADGPERATDRLAQVEAELRKIRNSLSEEDGIAVWQYAGAIHDYEFNRALSRMSDEVRRSDVYTRYRDLFEELRRLR